MGLQLLPAVAKLNTYHDILHRMWNRLQPSIKDTVDPDRDLPVDFFLAKMVSETLSALEGGKGKSHRDLWGFYSDAGTWDRLVKSYQRKGMC